MGKKISVSELRGQLTTLLDQLDQGQSHFIVERNSREVAVLLSMEKFQEIMQMLELLNTLEFIDTGLIGLDDGAPEQDFPDLMLLPPVENSNPNAEKPPAPKPRSRKSSASIEDMANKLGIRVIK